MAVACMGTVAVAQQELAETAAFVTVVGGEGQVMRLHAEGADPIKAFSLEASRIGPGEGVQTEPDATAVLMLPGYDAVVYLEGSSELRLVEPKTPDSGVGPSLLLRAGRASVIRKPDHAEWLLVAAEAQEAAGYTLSKGASLVAESQVPAEPGSPGRVTFAVRQGEALYFSGQVLAAALVGASGDLLDKSGVVVSQGHRVSTQIPPRPVPDEGAGPVAPGQLGDDMEKFALAQSYRWLERAEQGDFTPVRGAERGAPQPLSAEIEPSLVFDQPRPILAAPSLRRVTTPVRATLSPAQTLAESDVPATAVAGQRFRRTRIIGPATAATGAIRINPAARGLIQLRRH